MVNMNRSIVSVLNQTTNFPSRITLALIVWVIHIEFRLVGYPVTVSFFTTSFFHLSFTTLQTSLIASPFPFLSFSKLDKQWHNVISQIYILKSYCSMYLNTVSENCIFLVYAGVYLLFVISYNTNFNLIIFLPLLIIPCVLYLFNLLFYNKTFL